MKKILKNGKTKKKMRSGQPVFSLCLHFEEFQPIYTYAIKIMLIKNVYFR